MNWSKNNTHGPHLKGASFVENIAQSGGTFAGADRCRDARLATSDLRGNDFVRCGRGLIVGRRQHRRRCLSGCSQERAVHRRRWVPGRRSDGSCRSPIPIRTGPGRSAPASASQGADLRRSSITSRAARCGTARVARSTTSARTRTRTSAAGRSPSARTIRTCSGPVVGPGAGTPVVIDQDWFQGLGSGFGPVGVAVHGGRNVHEAARDLGRLHVRRQVGARISSACRRSICVWPVAICTRGPSTRASIRRRTWPAPQFRRRASTTSTIRRPGRSSYRSV